MYLKKASLCLQTMVHFETRVYTVKPRSSLISTSVGRAEQTNPSTDPLNLKTTSVKKFINFLSEIIAVF